MRTIPFVLIALNVICFKLHSQNINQEKSTVSFEISNMGLNTVEGTFKGMNGTVRFEPNELSTSKFEVCVDASSVKSGIDKRDESLRSEDFFFVSKYPQICFKSKQVIKKGDAYEVIGDLLIKGISKEATIFFVQEQNSLKGSLTINRFDFNIGTEYGSFSIGKEAEMGIICTLN